jgi:hypothetical protein
MLIISPLLLLHARAQQKDSADRDAAGHPWPLKKAWAGAVRAVATMASRESELQRCLWPEAILQRLDRPR